MADDNDGLSAVDGMLLVGLIALTLGVGWMLWGWIFG